ncbi:MAG: serine/threonine protein phosphatase [Sphingomonadales bacterium]|nr:serine/threonine protein phosphatase [Sphingomonadales bacterium]
MASAASIQAAQPTWPTGKVDGQLIYAIGDIHGCYDQLRRLLSQIASDAKVHANGRTTTLIFCGDYVDRGPASREVLDALCWLKRHQPFDLQFLKGNHEQVMLNYMSAPARTTAWLRFGGSETLQSYGVTPPAPDDGPEAHLAARDDLLERLPVAHLRFLQDLELMIGVGDYAFVHAGVRHGVALAKQEEDDLLWIREEFLETEAPHDRIIVHGHTWESDQPQIGPYRIGIDTGAYATGVLTALRLEDNGISTLAAR